MMNRHESHESVWTNAIQNILKSPASAHSSRVAGLLRPIEARAEQAHERPRLQLKGVGVLEMQMKSPGANGAARHDYGNAQPVTDLSELME